MLPGRQVWRKTGCSVTIRYSLSAIRFPNVRLQEHRQPALHGLSDEGRPRAARARDARLVGGTLQLCAIARGRQRPAGIRSSRWTAVCEWGDPHRARGQQDLEGHHRQVAGPRRVRRALCPGLGLSRLAHRAPGGEGEGPRGSRDGRALLPRGLPGLRARAGGPAAGGFQAPRRARRLGSALPDHAATLRGRAAARVRPDHP
jgi:hypothetical protein